MCSHYSAHSLGSRPKFFIENIPSFQISTHFYFSKCFSVVVVTIIGLTVIICGAIGLYLRRKRFQESLTNRSYTLSGFDRFDDAAGGEQEQLLDPICDNRNTECS